MLYGVTGTLTALLYCICTKFEPCVAMSLLYTVAEFTAPAITLPAVILPVVVIVFEPNPLARKLLTLAFEYVAGNPVSCDPLPKIYAPVILPVAETTPPVCMLPPVTLPVADT